MPPATAVMDAPGPAAPMVFHCFIPSGSEIFCFLFLLRAFAFRPTRDVCPFKRRMSREREGLFSRHGELDASFLSRMMRHLRKPRVPSLQNTWRGETRAVAEGMAPAELHAELKSKQEDEHLLLQLSVFIQRDVPGGLDGGLQAVCT